MEGCLYNYSEVVSGVVALAAKLTSMVKGEKVVPCWFFR